MKIKIITNGEEKEFDIDRVSDIQIENDNGIFNELGIEDIRDTLTCEVLDQLNKEDIAEYVKEETKIKLSTDIIYSHFTLDDVINSLCDDFDKQPEDLIEQDEEGFLWK